MSYHQFQTEDTEEGYDTTGSFEVFHKSNEEATWTDEDGEQHTTGAGWYWWPCFPGCLPDGDPIGPFGTEEEAINNAQGE